MRTRLVVLGCVLAVVLAALGLGWWLWRPPLPAEPKYLPLDLPDVRLWTRTDQVDVEGLALRPLGDEAELWIESTGDLGPVMFQLDGRLDEVTLRSRGSEKRTFRPPESGTVSRLFFEWQPRRARSDETGEHLYYRLVLSGLAGDRGTSLAFLGTREFLERDLYGVSWVGCGAPEAVGTGEEFLVLAHLSNISEHPWPHDGNARVRLSYRWLDADGAPVVHEAAFTALDSPVEPDAELARWMRVRAPETSGRYVLELDPVFEPMASFSDKGVETCRVEVGVGVVE